MDTKSNIAALQMCHKKQTLQHHRMQYQQFQFETNEEKQNTSLSVFTGLQFWQGEFYT